MLYSPDPRSRSRILEIPRARKQSYDMWRARLSDDEYDAIMEELASRIEGIQVVTSSWIPGADWTGTVFQPIYEKACLRDSTASSWFFGLLVWEAFLNHEEAWSFIQYKKDDVPIKGTTYFRISDPPPE